MEEPQSPTISTASKDSFSGGRTLGIVIGVIVLCALSFYGGVAYQKGHTRSTTTAASGAGGFGGGFGGARRGGFGTVTAVNSSSITVQNQRTGTNTTYTITSSTQVTKSGSSASVSDIQTGDTVIVRTSSFGSTTAMNIDDDPSFGPGAAQPGSSGSGTSTSTPAQST